MGYSPWSRGPLVLTLFVMDVALDSPRRCSAPDCPTVLSAYNSDHLCFVHADERVRRSFERASTRALRYWERVGEEADSDERLLVKPRWTRIG